MARDRDRRSRSLSRGRADQGTSHPRRRRSSGSPAVARIDSEILGRKGSLRDRSRSPRHRRREASVGDRERSRGDDRHVGRDRRYSPPPRPQQRAEGERGEHTDRRHHHPQQKQQSPGRGWERGRDLGDQQDQWRREGGGGRERGGPGRGRGGGRRGRDDGQEGRMQWGNADVRRQEEEEEQPDVVVEPEFGLSGALAAEANTVKGVVLVHTEPPEARKPTHRWRLYVFKKGEPFGDPLHIHRQSCYLFGRERRVADVPTDHPSCSKQHAVLQFRLTEKEGGDGMMRAAVRPYIMDLGSTNGTFINNERVEGERYYELLNQDMLKFGNSSREYVLLRDDSKGG